MFVQIVRQAADPFLFYVSGTPKGTEEHLKNYTTGSGQIKVNKIKHGKIRFWDGCPGRVKSGIRIIRETSAV